MFEVIKPGLFTTVQDLGRIGYQQYGMVVSGAMDPFALRMGNLLVGNDENDAALEITMVGPVLKTCRDCLIAVTGADLGLRLDGHPIPTWKSVWVRQGAVLSFAGARQGCRAYLAVRGGIDVPPVMGSRSTYVKAGIGGYNGRPLRSGDVLEVGIRGLSERPRDDFLPFANRRLPPEMIPRYGTPVHVRVILGPQHDMFTMDSLEAFLREPYLVTPQSDRMGYRLKGARLTHTGPAEIISDSVACGSIQVPAGGNPILLLADRQPTGGYPKIATVISVDLSLVAQAKPGDHICFHAVSLEESHRLLRQREQTIQMVKTANRLVTG
ncbi:MAG: biotin-dependent carboxyltransferase family protein [Brevibacillus sp.]|nr:biotin-dependent carboxyltransferase family protein [Brevibacillus sp.]